MTTSEFAENLSPENPINYRFNQDRLAELAIKYKEEFNSGYPFKHVVIDNFLPENVLDEVINELPSIRPNEDTISNNSKVEHKKSAASDPEFFKPSLTNLFYQLNGLDFLDFMEQLTGIKGLIADTRLDGGGYHLTKRAGHLRIHTDFSHPRHFNLRRRINIIIYLNRDWAEEYGGHLELWDKDLTECKKKVLPIFNRCVIFETNQNSPHGHPEPLTCPDDRGRQSLALYYYDNPQDEVAGIPTNYMKRPGTSDMGSTTKRIVRSLTPPILWDLAKRIKNI